nr:hypothetical protein [Candidatus Parabeggiatoa sp.]
MDNKKAAEQNFRQRLYSSCQSPKALSSNISQINILSIAAPPPYKFL